MEIYFKEEKIKIVHKAKTPLGFETFSKTPNCINYYSKNKDSAKGKNTPREIISFVKEY